MSAGVALMSAVLVGCGSNAPITAPSSSPVPSSSHSAALDRVVAASNAAVPRLMSMFANVYSKIEFSANYPSTLVVTYTYLKTVDAVVAKPQIDAKTAALQASCRSNFYRAMSTAGISHPTAKYVWLNPDGSAVDSFTCAP